MAEENQVTTKDPKKVEAGKRLAEYNRRKREELKVQKSEELKSQKSEVLTSCMCYSILAVGVIGGLWLLRLPSQGQQCCTSSTSATITSACQTLRLVSLKWSKSLLYYKMDKKSIVNDLY